MTKIVVVGAAGFIGQALTERLVADGVPTLTVTRRAASADSSFPTMALGELSTSTDWAPVLAGASAVVHLAARAHQPSGTSRAWAETEAAAAASLAAAAARAGLRQVVLVSSVKALGERTAEAPFRADQPPAPADAYGVAKVRMEAAMAEALQGSGTGLTIVRPPLVYGPGVRANFLALLRLVSHAPALPFASIQNRRSLIYRENLIDLLVRILGAPQSIRGTFLARDGEDLSTPELVRCIGRELGHTPRLLPCPVVVLRAAARLLGQADAMARLTDSLQLDDTPTRRALAWEPPYTTARGLAATCRWFRENGASRG
jgi:UDP-N-acetyl-alpha-D-quinovosamine dehydrogenase